jgi:hypothetical protein
VSSILLPDIDDELLTSLTKRANARKIPIEKEILNLLRESVIEPVHMTLRERAEAIAAMTPKGVKQTDSTLLIREDRDR